MKEITKKMFNGDINVCQSGIPWDDPAIEILAGITQGNRDYFRGKTNKEDAARFDSWIGHEDEANTLKNYMFFDYGFRMGVQLMCEVFFAEDKPPVADEDDL